MTAPPVFDFDVAFDRIRDALGSDNYRFEQKDDSVIIRPFARVTGPDGPTVSLGTIRIAVYQRAYIWHQTYDRPAVGVNVASTSIRLCAEHPIVRRALQAVWNELDLQAEEGKNR